MHAEVPSNAPGLVLDYLFQGGPAVNTALDQSPFANHGSISTSYEIYGYPPLVPTLRFTGTPPVTIQVEDGKGDVSTQTFAIDIVDQRPGSITGTSSDAAVLS